MLRTVGRAVGLVALVGCGEAAAPGTGDGVPADDTGEASSGTPGAYPFRRLNRLEYVRSVRLLTGLDLALEDLLPPDDRSHGFDVAAEALAISPFLVEAYDASARRIADAIVREPLRAPLDRILQAEDPADERTLDAFCGGEIPGGFAMACAGQLSKRFEIPEEGTYRLSARVWGDQAGDALPRAHLLVDGGAPRAVTDVVATAPDAAEVMATEVALTPGAHTLALVFENDFYDHEAERDRNLYVDAFRVEGPVGFTPPADVPRDRFLGCLPEDDTPDGPGRDCVAALVDTLAPQVWRRPLSADETESLMFLYGRALADGGRPEEGAHAVLHALFLSPWFTFRHERLRGDGTGRVDDVTLASRLAHLVWSGPPDAELLALAADDALHPPDVLAAQVRRMLRDPRADGFVDAFAGQWLSLRGLADASPDPTRFPEVDDALRAAMHDEMVAAFESFLGTDRPLTALLDPTLGFVDARLAEHYGVPAPSGGGMVAYDASAAGRGGWLGLGGWLLATSQPTRTSPVKRGVWVLEHLLCDGPGAPPAGVEDFPEEDAERPATVRERLEQHRLDPSCAVCHDAIDPVGLALEGFDAVGRTRTHDAGRPVDTTGELPDGTPVDGLASLQAVLADDPRFTPCMIDRAFVFSHGRTPTDAEAPLLEAAHEAFVEGGTTLDALVTAVVGLPSFSMPSQPAAEVSE